MGIGKKIKDYIYQKGVEAIYNECNHDIKDVRNKIIRELEISKGTDISRHMKKIKNFVHSITESSRQSSYVKELFAKLNCEVGYDS